MDPGDEFPTDVLVEILLLLRPSSCRRCRLVCRRWRDAVDRWTTEMQSRPKVLVAVGESAYVLDDRPAAERGRKLWRTGSDMARRYSSGMDTVGTCNGLVCLCNRMSGGAAITVANPLTGSALALRVTGRYKVVHVPFFFEQVWVFTLGETSWRDVVVATASPKSHLKPGAGIVSVDGTTYWATEGAKTKVMSIDLEDDHVTSMGPIPWYLAEVHGRLGIAISDDTATTVWVLEGARGGERSWSRWYITHFAHGGECILTLKWLPWRNCKGSVLYRHHRPGDDRREARRGTVDISERNKGAVAAIIETRGKTCWTFNYVETTEPLSVYECR
ncbi:hypothetical protein BRADI_3g39115v3 [Brachypodium distachyon]|uniref:F-box domain-containing protein n=1 Tax=Brachypodium distachyon TaxID=15368 RepID=A0A0Q3QAS6_BRADI|nr:hypothetical protein BRADI_3g39115v3 [Brachypodium distachyon]